MKKIGVVIATFNGEKYIEEQIKSILCQTVQPDIIVISDGGSTDETIVICNQILIDSGIDYWILESKSRLQVTENFQKGIEHCDADYIFFSDQDDVWCVDKVKKTMAGFCNDKIMMVFTNAEVVDSELKVQNGKSLWEMIGFQLDSNSVCFEQYNEFFMNTLMQHNIVTGMCLAISSKLKPFLLPFPKIALHDTWIALCSIHHGSVVAINERCVLYRQHENNVVGTKLNIKRIIKNGKKYLSNVEDRLNFILEVYNHSGEYENLIAEEMIERYIAFLRNRCAFLRKENSVLYPLDNLILYKKYEYNHWIIILKDYYVRLLMSE